MARKLQVEIVGDASGLERAFKSAGSAGSKFGGTLGHVAKGAGLLIGGGALGGIAAVLHQGVGEWKDSTTVAGQTSSVLKSTGGIANVTAGQVDDLSTSLMNKSGTDDEAIKSGENMLLTFTNIRNEAGKGNDIFDQATGTLLDMATAMNNGATPSAEQLSKQAIQLGKAINDPVKGMGALRRVGVTFTDAQKDQVQAMVDAGNVMGAQKLILHELTTEFGGSAEAAGKTLPGQLNILKETFNNVSGELVANLIPALTGIVNWVNQHWSEIQTTISAVFTAVGFAFTNILKPALDAIVQGGEVVVAWVRENWPQIHAVVLSVFTALQGAWNSVLKPVLETIQKGFEQIVAWTREHWPEISAVISGVFTVIKTIVTTTVTVISGIWNRFGDEILTAARQAWEHVRDTIKNILEVIRGVIDVIVGLIHGDWGRAWDGIKEITSGITNQIKNIISAFKDQVVLAMRLVGDLAGAAYRASLGKAVDFTKEIVSAILGFFASLPGKIGGFFAQIPGAIGAAASAAGQAALRFASSIAGGIRDGLSAIGGYVASLLKAPINAAIAGINSLRIPPFSFSVDTHIPGVGSLGFSFPGVDPIPSIPYLAAGGIVTRPTLAMIGEAGPEAVVPLSALGGRPFENHIHVYLDKKELFTEVQREGVRWAQRNQKPVFGT